METGQELQTIPLTWMVATLGAASTGITNEERKKNASKIDKIFIMLPTQGRSHPRANVIIPQIESRQDQHHAARALDPPHRAL